MTDEGTDDGGTTASTAGRIIPVLALPMIGILIIIIAASVVRISSGSLGLLMVKGRATDTTCRPARISSRRCGGG